ncbi:MAG: HAMP domain-containing sensor histidine kinase [Alphaproteobacteria bacterium]|nr:HAMP domain-containing sensor histidine kinase [Alphaproteobacteria bacterium]
MNSRFARILHTFTFRLTLVYVAVFSLSVILLFGFIYTFTRNYTQNQVNDSIKMQYSYLLSAYRDNGSAGVEQRITQLIAEDDEAKEIYLLVNKDFEKIEGNLNIWPTNVQVLDKFNKNGEWIIFHIESSRNQPQEIEVKALVIPLSKWRYLLVGLTTQELERIEQIIIRTFFASLIVTLIMAFAGALVMTRSVMKRINVINRSAYTIMHGNLTARIPFTKGGDEFDDLSANLNMMLDKIEMLLQSISLFANNIAHDLRSPLSRIITRLDAGLRKIDVDNPARNLLEKNIHDMEGLVATFNSILKISELEASTELQQFSTVNLREVLSDLVEFYEPMASERHISLTTLIDERLVVHGERHLLAQAFANLLDNAIKFTPSQGHIHITTEARGDYVDVSIADSGSGIPENYHEKVFEKFFRIEESRHTKGNGLGLSLVAAIARIHKAEIMLSDNKPGLKVTLILRRV